MYLLGGISGAAGVALTYLSSRDAAFAGVGTLLIVLIGVLTLERAPFERQARKAPVAGGD
jgi:hypothetical protein